MKKTIRFLLLMTLLCVMTLAPVCPVYAAGEGAFNIDADRAATLTITTRYGQTPISGATVYLYKIADVSGTADSVKYTACGPFAKYVDFDAGVIVDGVQTTNFQIASASGWESLSKALARLIDAHRTELLRCAARRTGRDGRTVFENNGDGTPFGPGLYLARTTHDDFTFLPE